jgi:glycosyltransferase involved in cell wall biosynthesis
LGAACWLSAPNNTAELANRLSNFYNFKVKSFAMGQMGQSGRSLVEQQFTLNRVAKQFAAVYRWLPGKAGQRDCVDSLFRGARLSQ